MKNKSCCNRAEHRPATKRTNWFAYGATLAAAIVAVSLGIAPAARCGDAPAWMHSLVSAPLPEHDEKTDAILMYSEDILTVKPDGKMKRLVRRAYKILMRKTRMQLRRHCRESRTVNWSQTSAQNCYEFRPPIPGTLWGGKSTKMSGRSFIRMSGGFRTRFQ